jgi:biopolymer transport protein TolQ
MDPFMLIPSGSLALPFLLQATAPRTTLDLILGGTFPTLVVLTVLAVFSVLSWILIFWKWKQFRIVRGQGDQFLDTMERAQRLEEAYRAILSLPDSPYGRLFRQGVNFFSELRPGSLREGAPKADGLSPTQLESLRMVMEKVENEERDELSHGLTWLAVIGSVAPLLGLMGTVIGVMNAFLGIVATGSTNIGAVAPGVAEALITTVVGLAVAIPAVIGYNYFVARLNLVSGELEGFSSEFIGTLAREGRV